MARATQAIIHLPALIQNYQLAKQHAPQAKAYAVIKANAYGHGLQGVAKGLAAQADGFAVACVEEADQIRAAGVDAPIMVLEGPYNEAECQHAAQQGYELVVHQAEQLAWLAQVSEPLTLWIKVDTGMHRLGFAMDQVREAVQRLQQPLSCGQHHQLGLLSHFACADDQTSAFNQLQLSRFQSLADLNLPMSMSNSAAIMSLTSAHGERLRPGIMLYGGSPLLNTPAQTLGLKPVMTLRSEVIAVHQLTAGETVGYGQTWLAPRDCKVAVVAIGYGDGYPRRAPNGTPVWLRGQRAWLAGRVSMDMITVDVTEVEGVQLGDTVELWGEHIPVDEIAHICNTISYELFCQLTPRVKRIYTST